MTAILFNSKKFGILVCDVQHKDRWELTAWMTDILSDRHTDRPPHSCTEWTTRLSTPWFTDWLTDPTTDLLTDRPSQRLNDQQSNYMDQFIRFSKNSPKLYRTHRFSLSSQILPFITFLSQIPPVHALSSWFLNPLNAKLNTICHLLALLGAHHILHVSRIRVNVYIICLYLIVWKLP